MTRAGAGSRLKICGNELDCFASPARERVLAGMAKMIASTGTTGGYRNIRCKGLILADTGREAARRVAMRYRAAQSSGFALAVRSWSACLHLRRVSGIMGSWAAGAA